MAMSVRLRTARVTLGLAGFFAIEAVFVVGAFLALGDAWSEPGRWSFLLLVLHVWIVAGLVMGWVRAARRRSKPDVGVEVAEESAPELWRVVRAVAADLRTAPFDRVLLIAEHDLRSGTVPRHRWGRSADRTLVIGVPLLQLVDVAELRWLLATCLVPLRDRHVMDHHGIRRIGRVLACTALPPASWTPVGIGLRSYAVRWTRSVAAAKARDHLRSLRIATELTGSDVGWRAQRRLHVSEMAWAEFDASWLLQARLDGWAPRPLFAAYASHLSESGKAELGKPDDDCWQRWEGQAFPEPADVTALRAGGEVAAGSPPDLRDAEPALTLLADPVALAAEVEEQSARDGGLAPTTWEEAFPRARRTRGRHLSAQLMEVVARLAVLSDAPTRQPTDLAATVRHVASDDRRRVAAVLSDLAGRDGSDELALDFYLRALVSTALVEAGLAAHVLRWDRADVIADEAGVEVDLDALLDGVSTDPEAAEWLLRTLEAEGIPGTWTPPGSVPG